MKKVRINNKIKVGFALVLLLGLGWLFNYVSKPAQGMPILLYHMVNDGKSSYAITPTEFEEQMKYLKEEGYTTISLLEYVKARKGKLNLPEKPLVISFDDGYLDNYTYAYPILREEGAKATFFIVSGSVGKDNRMTQDQIKELISKGFSIGSHTVSHNDLSKMSDEEIEHQLKDSQKELEDMFGVPIDAIAYPCGYENPSVVKIAEKYYRMGFLASMEKDETVMTINRHGVFRWTNHISSLTNR